jgi:hypothetical protein
MTESNTEESDEIDVRLTMLMEAVRQNLSETLQLFEGFTMSMKQAPLLNALLDLVSDTLMTWER